MGIFIGGNLLRPQLGIPDWEMWGQSPAGTDVATLYLHSLRNPDVFHRIYSEFAEILGGPDGITAQLWVAARLVERINNSGDFPDLEAPLRKHIEKLLF